MKFVVLARILISMTVCSSAASALAEIPSVDPRVADGRALAKEGKYTEAGDKFKDACDKKVGEGCYYLANAVRDYRYAPATLEAHYALKEKSCSLKFARGCFSIGFDYRTGPQGLNIDKAKGNAFMEKSCQLGWGSGCGARAADYQYGFNETPKDENKAFIYFKKGCDAEQPSPEACEDLATIYAEGIGAPKNLDLALEAIKKALGLSPDNRGMQTIARILVAEKQKALQ
ncbi:MAG: tetratricopeptide repeat protein [Pontixanthobacter sp.]